ncbi:hypothetical protein ACRRNT_003784 [Proteus mirabilis]
MLMLFSIFIIDFCTKATDALGKYGSNVRKAYAPITMGIILLIFLYLAGISIFKYYLIGMAIFIAFLILSTFFEKKKTKNNDKNQSDNKKPKGNGDLSATTKILSFFMLLFFSYGFILALGTYNARTTTSFYYFTVDNNNYAIINKFDDNVITKVINKDKKLEDSVYIYKSDSLNSKEIKYMKVIEDNN